MSDFTGGSGVSAGGILRGTFSTVFENTALFLGLSLVGTAAGEISSKASYLFMMGGAVLPIILNVCVSLLISMFIQGALTYAAFQIFTGEKVSAGASVARAFSRVVQLFFLTVMVGLLSGVAIAVASIPGFALGVLWIYPVTLVLVLFFTSIWCVAVPACVVEKLSPTASIERSQALTKSFRLKIIGVMAAVYALSYGFRYVGSFAGEKLFGEGYAASAVIIAVTFIPAAFANTIPAVIYYALRSAKENIADMSLAEIFD